jgi:LysM repeat protein
MKKIRRLKSGLSPILICCTFFFLSCAHEGANNASNGEGGLFADMGNKGDDASGEAPSDSTEAKPDVAASDSSDPKPSDLDAEAPKADEAKGASADDKLAETASADADKAIGLDPAADKAADATATPPLMTDGKPEGTTPPSDGTTAKADEAAPAPEAAAPVPDAAKIEQAAAEQTKIAPEAAPGPEIKLPDTNPAPEATPAAEAQAAPVAPEATVAAAPKHHSMASLPQIPTKPIWRKGEALNRYYVLRSKDSAESVSNLIYGTADRANSLSSWNTGSWDAGRVILYVSADAPKDKDVKSFYEERGLAAQSYVVKEGDWLSKIAASNYGSPKSWKEIAIVNHLASPNNISTGTTIQLYPTTLAAREPANDKVAMNDKPVIQPKAPEVPAAPPISAPAPAAEPVITHSADQAALTPSESVERSPIESSVAPNGLVKKGANQAPKLASAQIGDFLVGHAGETFGIGIAMLIGFLIMRRMRRNGNEVESEE